MATMLFSLDPPAISEDIQENKKEVCLKREHVSRRHSIDPKVSSLGRRHMWASAEEHGLLVYERDFFCLFPDNHDTSPYLGSPTCCYQSPGL